MQLTAQHLRTTEEHTCLGRTVNLPDTLEYHIPVRSSEIRWRSETCDSILLRIDIVDHDIRCIISLDLGGKICVDFNVVVHILGFDSEEERSEPFERSEIATNPEEVDLAKTGLLLWVIHSVPDRLQDGGEGGDTDTRTTEKSNLELEHIF